MNIVISDPKTSKAYSYKSDKPVYAGKKLGDQVDLSLIGLSGYTGQITGGFFVGTSLGGMFLPWFIGQLFVPAGPQVMLVAVLVDLALALGALAAFLWQSERGKR